MQAAIARNYGPPGVIEIGEMPDPEPKSGEVLVRIRASSLNPIDYKLRSGSLGPMLRLKFPAILGFDLAGEVVQTGSGITEWEVGDRVYGRIDSKTGGTHAEVAAVRADILDRVPDEISMEEAAALPLTGMTALQALRKAGLSSGHKLLVNGAGGGVGTPAVQVGRAWGAEVVGVCRGEDAELVRSLGASRTLDYTKGEMESTTERFDVIFDTVFNRPMSDFTRLLDTNGTFTTTGFSPALGVRSVLGWIGLGPRMQFLISRPEGRTMRELSELVASDALRPVVDSTFPLTEISMAYERLENEHTQGKVVIRIS